MREILFRGKRIDNGEWVSSGNLITFNDEGEGKQFFIPEANAKCTSTHDEQDNIIAFPSGVFYKVDPKTIGQYTGLTDKNGKKIFEGDILRYTGWVTEYDDFCYVVFDCAEFALKFVTMDKQTMGKEDLARLPLQRGLFEFCEGKNAFEVIGNIHDNPELLEVTADGA